MCVLAFAWRADPRWLWVLAGNRDELHARPAEPLHRWPDASQVLAGRDVQSGGSWLGVSEQGRMAVVTNISGYGPPAPDAPSRGDLVKDALIGSGPYAALDPAEAARFNPFNLVRVDGAEATLWSNRPGVEHRLLAPGVMGLSNGQGPEPWPKTARLMQRLSAWLAEPGPAPRALLDALGEVAPPPGAEAMPEGGGRTGVFVKRPVYGTRCSTVAAVDAAGCGVIVERRFDAEGRQTGQSELEFVWPI